MGSSFLLGYAVALAMTTMTMPADAGEMPRTIGLYPANGPSLAMLDSKIELTVRGPIIEAVVTQRFHNRSDRATEATYVFPLPVDAAVSAMAIRNGNRTIRATIERRDEAQRRYEAAIRAGIAGALLDQERPDVFTQTVAAIPAKGTVEIVLRFDTTARFHDGGWELALPLVIAPRYVPGTATNQPTTGTGRAPDTDRAPDASRVTPGGAPGAGGATEVVVHFVDKPSEVTSPSHELRNSGSDATLTDPKTDHDAIVRWKTTASAAGWLEQTADGGYAAVVVEASAPAPRKSSMRCVLVLDRSAAAQGDADAVSRPLVRSLLGALGPADRIAVAGSDQLGWASPADVARALDPLWSTPAGVFDLTRALAVVRSDGAPVVLVSGGLVADDRAAVAAAVKLNVPIHVIGVGPAPARGVLAQVAAATGGTLRFATPGDDLVALAKAALADAGSPPAPLTVTWGTLAATEVVPGNLPRIGSGQATLVLARVARAQTANGRARGELFAIEALPAARVVDGATTAYGPLARRWARNRLDELIAARATAAIVTAHAMRYGLVSPFTSMVAIGDEVVVQGGVKRSIAIPVSVPAGMKWQLVKKQTTVGAAESGEFGGRDGHDTKPATTSPPAAPPVTRGYTKKPPREGPKPEPAPQSGTPIDRVAVAPAPTLDARRDEDGDADDYRYAPEAQRVGVAQPAETAAGRRTWRVAATFGGGVLRSRTASSALLALGSRLERRIGSNAAIGLDGAVWLVDGDELAGNALLAVGWRGGGGVARWLEAGIGFGVQLGLGVGPAGSLSLRLHLPPQPRAATYLRYDGAVVSEQAERHGQSSLTLGLEWGF